MLAVTVVGLLWSWILTGPTGGIGGFLILALALPALPVLGAPATGSTSKYLLAFLISGGVWLILGLVATNRALQRPIVTWREWTLEFAPLGLALMLGVVLGIGITALTIL